MPRKDFITSEVDLGKNFNSGEVVLQKRLSTVKKTCPDTSQSLLSIPSYGVHNSSVTTTFFNASASQRSNTSRRRTPVSPASSQPQMPLTTEEREEFTIFIPYYYRDRHFFKMLEVQLTTLNNHKWRHQGLNVSWIPYEITQDPIWATDISDPLLAYKLTLLLLGPEFIASEFFNSPQTEKALMIYKNERKSRILSILLHPCRLDLPILLNQKEILPSNKKPVDKWVNRDEAFVNISRGIEDAVDYWSIR